MSKYAASFSDPEQGGASYIESLLMTDAGLEILSGLPRTLAVIEG
jgi:hypothetical protein